MFDRNLNTPVITFWLVFFEETKLFGIFTDDHSQYFLFQISCVSSGRTFCRCSIYQLFVLRNFGSALTRSSCRHPKHLVKHFDNWTKVSQRAAISLCVQQLLLKQNLIEINKKIRKVMFYNNAL